MVTPVILMNLLIALFCLYAARKVWRLSKIWATAADALVRAERCTHAVLSGAPEAISRGQVGTQKLRQQYRQLELQIQRAQQLLALTGLSQVVWQWYTRRRMKRSPGIQTGQPQINRRSRRLS
jgi:predicted membrane metal-binding protein